MKNIQFLRKSHYVGSKIKSLRNQNNMTLEELSLRCMQIDIDSAPSVSYLSLIEGGKRSPTQKILNLLAEIFQKNIEWFLDDPGQSGAKSPENQELDEEVLFEEPDFLFSKEIMKMAIPDLMYQTGTTGRQFSHVLIRSLQEKKFNRFPDIERVAESIGKKKFPMSVEDLMHIIKKNNIKIKWFEKPTFITKNDQGHKIKTLFRSFYHNPKMIYINKYLKNLGSRLKYDLAYYIGHYFLHGGDGLVSALGTGGEIGGSPKPKSHLSGRVKQKDILFAWRDFECSYFAGALLCPRKPFRHFLLNNAYDIFDSNQIEIEISILVRRITSVSSELSWHYFDAYHPGYLRALYRGSKIPVPWGNMKENLDPCKKWAVSKMLNEKSFEKKGSYISQLSLLRDKNQWRLFCSKSITSLDAAGNKHVIAIGLDLVPLLLRQNNKVNKMLERLYEKCHSNKGCFNLHSGKIFDLIYSIYTTSNINWIKESLNNPIQIICQRSYKCPLQAKCVPEVDFQEELTWINEIKKEILAS